MLAKKDFGMIFVTVFQKDVMIGYHE